MADSRPLDLDGLMRETQQVLLSLRRQHAARLLKNNPPVPVPANGHHPPPQARWFALKWDTDYAGFDPASLRQEPDHEPAAAAYSWPWVYLPAIAYVNGKWRDVYAIIQYLGEHCTWQHGKQHIIQEVRKVGGRVVEQADPKRGSIAPDNRPAISYRQPITGKPRNRTRASQRPHTTLRRVIERETLLAQRKPDPHQPPDTSQRIPKTMRHYQPPPVAPHRTPTGGVQAREDELRHEHGLETIADAILAALSAPDKDKAPEPLPPTAADLKKDAKRLADMKRQGKLSTCPKCKAILLMGACPNGHR